MTHTPEPWLVTDDGNGLCVEARCGDWICRAAGNTIGQQMDNNTRIVACVNAMAGIEPQNLLDSMTEILEWEARMGGWDGPEWDLIRELHKKLATNIEGH